MISAAIRRALQALDPLELEQVGDERYLGPQNFASRHGFEVGDVRAALAAVQPKARADRFEWLQAVTANHRIGVRGLRVANALFSFAGPGGYLWPSQASLAKRSGYADDAEVRRGLASLVAVGAVRKLRVVDLPKHLATLAMGDPKDGGSGRSFKGSAYALVAPNEWTETLLRGTRYPSDDRDTVSLHNLQVEPELAPPEFLSDVHGAKQSASRLAETSHCGGEGGEHTSKYTYTRGSSHD